MALLVVAATTSCANFPTTPTREVEFDFLLLSRDGTPIENAEVIMEFRTEHSSTSVAFGTTEADGHARFSCPEGVYTATLYNWHGAEFPGFVEVPGVRVSASAPAYTCRLTGLYLTVNVSGPGGASLPDANVFVAGPIGTGDYDYQYMNGPSSRTLVRPGTYSITARGSAYPSPYPTVSSTVSITADTTLAFQLDGNLVEGTVIGEGGNPLPGAYVGAIGSSEVSVTGKTDANGHYFLYAPNGDYRWLVQPTDSMDFILDRAYGQETVTGPMTKDFSLGGFALSGHVFVGSGTEPMAGGHVRVTPWLMPMLQADCDLAADGSFRVVVEPGLEYDIGVYRPGYYDRILVKVLRTGAVGADSTFTIHVDPAELQTSPIRRGSLPAEIRKSKATQPPARERGSRS